jgi:hypothetical protein
MLRNATFVHRASGRGFLGRLHVLRTPHSRGTEGFLQSFIQSNQPGRFMCRKHRFIGSEADGGTAQPFDLKYPGSIKQGHSIIVACLQSGQLQRRSEFTLLEEAMSAELAILSCAAIVVCLTMLKQHSEHWATALAALGRQIELVLLLTAHV